ncbi:actin-related protein 2 [Hordeum vulgare]|nr:actin-related protein 2 [Hordeum vulgare]
MVPPICPCADEEAPPTEHVQSKISDDKDPYGPSGEVALDPPTLESFWGQCDICVWKSLLATMKARQVAFNKEMAKEKARYQATCDAPEAAWKKEAVELWGREGHRAAEVYADGYFARKVKGARRLIAAWRWADKL